MSALIPTFIGLFPNDAAATANVQTVGWTPSNPGSTARSYNLLAGLIYLNSSDSMFRIYTGAAWSAISGNLTSQRTVINNRLDALELAVAALDTRVDLLESRFTADGGLALPFVNATGAASVKGTVVEASGTTPGAFVAVTANDPDPFGVVYESGIADGAECLVTVAGIVKTLLQDSTASTRGYWVRVSASQAGRADATNAAPPGGTINAIDAHFREIGHAMSTEVAGSDVLADILVHFN